MQTGYKVIDVMTNRPVVASANMTLQDAAKLLEEENVNSLIIVEGDIAKGIITDEDIVRKVIARGLNPKALRLHDIMIKELITISPEKDIYDALLLMRDHSIRQLPVIDHKRLVGFLTSKDILKIEPELIDLVVEKYSLREEERKLRDADEESDFFEKLKIWKRKK